jgi:hypothetical protein
MKTGLLVGLSALFLSGCVYTHPSPYGYSRYTVVTPSPSYPRYDVPRYEAPRFYTPAPTPRFRYFEERPHFHSRQRSRRW